MQTSIFAIILAAVLGGGFVTQAAAQDRQDRWATGGGIAVLQYQAPSSLEPLNFRYADPALYLLLSRYLAKGFDFQADLTLAPAVHFPLSADNFDRRFLADMSYRMVFKLNNDIFLREESRFAPYLTFGMGGSYTPGHPDIYVPAGGGVRIRAGNYTTVFIQAIKKWSLNKDYQNLALAAGLTFTLSSGSEQMPTPPLLEDDLLLSGAVLPEATGYPVTRTGPALSLPPPDSTGSPSLQPAMQAVGDTIIPAPAEAPSFDDTPDDISSDLLVSLPFTGDSNVLPPGAIDSLRAVALYVESHPEAQLEVMGYSSATDSPGSHAGLGLQRARKVRYTLVTEFNLDQNRILVTQYTGDPKNVPAGPDRVEIRLHRKPGNRSMHPGVN